MVANWDRHLCLLCCCSGWCKNLSSQLQVLTKKILRVWMWILNGFRFSGSWRMIREIYSPRILILQWLDVQLHSKTPGWFMHSPVAFHHWCRRLTVCWKTLHIEYLYSCKCTLKLYTTELSSEHVKCFCIDLSTVSWCIYTKPGILSTTVVVSQSQYRRWMQIHKKQRRVKCESKDMNCIWHCGPELSWNLALNILYKNLILQQIPAATAVILPWRWRLAVELFTSSYKFCCSNSKKFSLPLKLFSQWISLTTGERGRVPNCTHYTVVLCFHIERQHYTLEPSNI